MKEIALNKLVSFLNAELSLSDFPRDESINGLQIQGKGSIKKIGVAVDACAFVFEKAAEMKIDFLVVHHGLIWGGIKSVSGILQRRISMLLKADISLYACHLPLDWHPEYGNNAELLRMLSIARKGEFGEYHGKKIGYWGRTRREMSLEDFNGHVRNTLKAELSSIDFGRKVRNVGVVSGGGWSALHDAERYGIDTFLTGEPSHSAYTLAEELRVNLVFAGHYATETPGVRAAGRMLKTKFGIPAEFIDHPTGL